MRSVDKSNLDAALGGIGSAPLLVAVDFDGTIAPIVPHPPDASPVPGSVDCLQRLAGLPDTWVALVSGRARDELAMLAGVSEKILLLGSHGVESAAGDSALTTQEKALLHEARQQVNELAATVPGLFVESKPASVTLHYRRAIDDQAGAEAGRQLAAWAQERGLHVVSGKKVVEVGVRALDKGSAVRQLRQQLDNPALLFAGDDVTDESVMESAQPTDVTIRIGPGVTAARFRLADPEELVSILKAFERSRTQILTQR